MESVPEPGEIGNVIEEAVYLVKQINLEVDSDDVQELLVSHNQERTIEVLTHSYNKYTREGNMGAIGDGPDSQAAILALSSNTPTDYLNTIQCRTKIVEVISYGWIVVLKRVPSHFAIPGNERANQKAKQGAESSQPEISLTIRRTKSIISTCIDKYTAVTPPKNKSFGKPWETLATVDPIPRHMERAEAIARFYLIAGGHDFFGVYLYWLAWLLTRPSRFTGECTKIFPIV
ncbi:reverse transcriptase [Trichonephila clavipes]|nr:reverse transcriptase [Trichonephila clavipes]